MSNYLDGADWGEIILKSVGAGLGIMLLNFVVASIFTFDVAVGIWILFLWPIGVGFFIAVLIWLALKASARKVAATIGRDAVINSVIFDVIAIAVCSTAFSSMMSNGGDFMWTAIVFVYVPIAALAGLILGAFTSSAMHLLKFRLF